MSSRPSGKVFPYQNHPLDIIVKAIEYYPWLLNDKQIVNLLHEHKTSKDGNATNSIGGVIINLLIHGQLKPQNKLIANNLVLYSGMQSKELD